jgi:hypothetical protein
VRLERYDHLLHQRNERADLPHPADKLQEECAEVVAAVAHLRDGRPGAIDRLATEMGHMLLAARATMLAEGITSDVLLALEAKARELHAIILKGD